MYEYCVLIRQTGYTYIIPCIEVMRAAYANKSFLANCALNTSGLTQLTLNEMKRCWEIIWRLILVRIIR